MATFTIIGFWTDTLQRVCLHVTASSADAAETRCASENRGLAVCGVVTGEHMTSESAELVGFDDAIA
jgi:hypothetical protein